MRKRVRLIHWNETEAHDCVVRLREVGYKPEFDPFTREILKAINKDPPDVIVIDLSRLPSQGRDIGFNLRKSKSTRRVPIVFCSGVPQKVARIQSHFPDAVFCDWDTIQNAIEQAVSNPPVNPNLPESVFEAYKGTPLPKKLGIKTNSKVLLINPPEDIESILGKMPDGVRLTQDQNHSVDLTLWFIRSNEELLRELEDMVSYAGGGGLWIIWPKKSSGVKSDLSQQLVRAAGLDRGMVDYKICAIDKVWSGLRFTQRKAV